MYKRQECIHASGIPNHYRDFRKAANEMELVGEKATQMALFVPTRQAPAYVKGLIKKLNKYPTPALHLQRPQEKQTTRMLKMECRQCGMILRVSNRWLEHCELCPDSECGGTLRHAKNRIARYSR